VSNKTTRSMGFPEHKVLTVAHSFGEDGRRILAEDIRKTICPLFFSLSDPIPSLQP